MPRLIHSDQAGFILGRQTADNTRKCVNLIDQAKRLKIPSLAITLDAEKAFDRVDWAFLHLTLRKFGLGPNFCSLIMANYAAPCARVRINGYKSKPFTLRRGTRQGCLLSPLLFAMVMEPMGQRIRDNDDIRGINLNGNSYKLSMFADDILATLSDPVNSVRSLLKELHTVELCTGFRINLSKSVILNVNLDDNIVEDVKRISDFTWAEDSITYLGVQITGSYSTLYKSNYPPMITSITRDLIAWRRLNVSWIGRIISLKKKSWKDIHYLFQTLPVQVPPKILRSLQAKFIEFVWEGKRPKVSSGAV